MQIKLDSTSSRAKLIDLGNRINSIKSINDGFKNKETYLDKTVLDILESSTGLDELQLQPIEFIVDFDISKWEIGVPIESDAKAYRPISGKIYTQEENGKIVHVCFYSEV